MKKYTIFTILLFCGFAAVVRAQQDPQYTQYMYTTQVINPGYTGSLEGVASLSGLYRSQWVGLDGAPTTMTFAAHTAIEHSPVGLGLSIVRDEIGPSDQTFANIDFSYTIPTGDVGRLAFGLKAGASMLNVDYTKLDIYSQNDPTFEQNVDNRFLPQIGAGLYFYTDRLYLGLSVPSFLETEHYDRQNMDEEGFSTAASERMHYFFIAGYVFDLSENVKFKPATLAKTVYGAPLQVDVSANFMFFEKFVLGAAYRWDAAWSGLAGFQLADRLFLGFAYDTDYTELRAYNKGSFEFFLRYDIFKGRRSVMSPRFF